MKTIFFILLVSCLLLLVSYTIQAVPIQLLYPNGGEMLEAGKTYQIKWSGSMNSLKFSNGLVIASNPDYDSDPSGSLFWTIPLTIPSGSYSIDIAGGGGTDRSDNVFTISSAQNLISNFSADPPAVSYSQPVTLSWAINAGTLAKLEFDCTNKSISFWVNQKQKIYHCGESIDDLSLNANFTFRPQDIAFGKVSVNFLLSVLDVGGPSLTGEKSLTIDFYPAEPIGPGYLVAPVKYIFNKDLEYGLKNNNDVKELQKVLISLGLLSSEATGNFYNMTLKAVKAFQKKYSIKQTGYVGPKTRMQLNQI